MNPLAFFRSPDVLHVLGLASRVAACPISLHTHAGAAESLRLFSTGACAACRFVAANPAGRAACQTSRVPHAQQALRRRAPVPFICHMGFACVTIAPFRPGHDPWVLTLGPYCPSPADPVPNGPALRKALEHDAESGLHELQVAGSPLPFTLEDVPVVPADLVPTVAEWLAASLRLLWKDCHAEPDALAAPAPPSPRPRRPRSAGHQTDPYSSAQIAAAVVAGDGPRVRRLIRQVMGEMRSHDRKTPEVLQARALAITGAVLEALAAAAVDVAKAWAELPVRLLSPPRENGEQEWSARVAGLLLAVPRSHREAKQGLIEQVDAIITPRLADPITLNDVAQALSCTPSAVTHALQRKFQLSFTEYLGRLRVHRAKDLLRQDGLAMAEIGRRVGIHDASNFARMFKKYEGLTPAAYRKRFVE